LQSYPRRFNSVLGAATAAREAGDKTSARAYYAQLIELAAPDSPRLAVKEARQYLSKR
jgi:cytochrome c-type biogenesis protein CcmH/NrfG